MNWQSIRISIIETGILGTYTTPTGQTLPSLSLDSYSQLPPGVVVTGLEVVIDPVESVKAGKTLGGSEYDHKGRCTLRQFTEGQGILVQMKKIIPLFDRVEISPRVTPTEGFAQIETISFTFRYLEVFND